MAAAQAGLCGMSEIITQILTFGFCGRKPADFLCPAAAMPVFGFHTGGNMDLFVFDNQKADAVILHPMGWMDHTNAGILKAKLDEALSKSPKKIVINMRDLAFMDLSGWITFLEVQSRIKANGGELRFASMNDEVFVYYAAMAMDTVISSYGTVREAVEQPVRAI